MASTKCHAENVYLSRPRFVMKFLGVWLPPPDEGTLGRLYRAFMVSLQYLFLLFQVIYIVQVWGDLEEVSQASYLLFTQACLCCKVTVFLANKTRLRRLLEHMNSQVFHPQNLEQERILKFHARRIQRLLLGFMLSSQATCGLWALKPLFDDDSREFPFKMWMPVSPERSPQYELGYAFQLLTICTSAYIYFGVDSVALSMVIFGCAQLDVIKHRFMDIKNVTMQDRISGRSKQLFEENYNKFVACIVQHQNVVKFTSSVEIAYHSYLLFQLSGSVGLFCMSALRILSVDWHSMQFFSILTYMSSMIMQLYICCWCGHELTHTATIDALEQFPLQSLQLFSSLDQCPWYEQSPRLKRVMLFTLMRMSRPIVFRAGHYVPLSRQTFISILRMSYSYFAVLRQAHKE